MADENVPFIRRVVIENYKSIRRCDVRLGPMTFLVGPNGSGKSNFLDALEFVRDSQLHALSEVIDMHGGLHDICHNSIPRDLSFSIKLELSIPTAGDDLTVSGRNKAIYDLSIREYGTGGFCIERESCEVLSDAGHPVASYSVENGQLACTPTKGNGSSGGSIPTDRLYLSSALNSPAFVNLSNLLACVSVYNISHDKVRATPWTKSISPATWLKSDGAGAGTVFRAMREPTRQRVAEYMRTILPSIEQIKAESLAGYAKRTLPPEAIVELLKQIDEPNDVKFLIFILRSRGDSIDFHHTAMSDGTLRAFAVLVALFQCADQPSESRIPLVSIEEPEATVHPAAAGVLFDALHEASSFTQVIATSHSAELLDRKDLDPDSLLVVDAPEGETLIGPADAASKSLLRDQLCTAGELMRQNQLKPDVGQGASTVESG